MEYLTLITDLQRQLVDVGLERPKKRIKLCNPIYRLQTLDHLYRRKSQRCAGIKNDRGGSVSNCTVEYRNIHLVANGNTFVGGNHTGDEFDCPLSRVNNLRALAQYLGADQAQTIS